jgi:hypothetical protein
VAQGRWFTIVATDLFAGAFAAILIIDAATPKEPITIGEPTLIRITFDAGPAGALDCILPYHVVVAFTDDQGEDVNSREVRMTGARQANNCISIGVETDLSVSSPPDDLRYVIAFRPASLAPLERVNVQIGPHILTCTSEVSCSLGG